MRVGSRHGVSACTVALSMGGRKLVKDAPGEVVGGIATRGLVGALARDSRKWEDCRSRKVTEGRLHS